MSDSTFILEKTGRMAVVTLNRPEVLNAFNTQMSLEVAAVLTELDQDQDIDVIIVTGAGEKAFCAGRDLKELATTDGMVGRGDDSVITILRNVEKPTIAAVNGFAITGGFELVLSCDIIIASENATFADTHARVGLLPGGGMSQLLPRLVGINDDAGLRPKPAHGCYGFERALFIGFNLECLVILKFSRQLPGMFSANYPDRISRIG